MAAERDALTKRLQEVQRRKEERAKVETVKEAERRASEEAKAAAAAAESYMKASVNF